MRHLVTPDRYRSRNPSRYASALSREACSTGAPYSPSSATPRRQYVVPPIGARDPGRPYGVRGHDDSAPGVRSACDKPRPYKGGKGAPRAASPTKANTARTPAMFSQVDSAVASSPAARGHSASAKCAVKVDLVARAAFGEARNADIEIHQHVTSLPPGGRLSASSVIGERHPQLAVRAGGATSR